MREIPFKGKAKKTGRWLYGDLVRNENGAVAIMPPFSVNSDNECSTNEVDKNTICEPAGLKDINEVEIYEGDIINACNYRGVIEFDCGVFGINWDYGRCDNRTTMYGTFGQRHNLRRMDDEIIDRIEIIGNIYDNPELINKEK